MFVTKMDVSGKFYVEYEKKTRKLTVEEIQDRIMHKLSVAKKMYEKNSERAEKCMVAGDKERVERYDRRADMYYEEADAYEEVLKLFDEEVEVDENTLA